MSANRHLLLIICLMPMALAAADAPGQIATTVVDLPIKAPCTVHLGVLTSAAMPFLTRAEAGRRALHDQTLELDDVLAALPDLSPQLRKLTIKLLLATRPEEAGTIHRAGFATADKDKERARIAVDLLAHTAGDERVTALAAIVSENRLFDLLKVGPTVLGWSDAATVIDAVRTNDTKKNITFVLDQWLALIEQARAAPGFIAAVPNGRDEIGQLYITRFGPAGAPALRAAIPTAADHIRPMLIDTLAALGDSTNQTYFRNLTMAMKDPKSLARIITALTSLNAPLTIDELVDWAGDRTSTATKKVSMGSFRVHRVDYPLAEAALEALGHQHGPTAYQTLIAALGNPDAEGTALIEAAAKGLATYGDPTAIDALQQARRTLKAQRLTADGLDEAIRHLTSRKDQNVLNHDELLIYSLTYSWDGGQLAILTDRPLIPNDRPGMTSQSWVNQARIRQKTLTIKESFWQQVIVSFGKVDGGLSLTIDGKQTTFDLLDAGGVITKAP